MNSFIARMVAGLNAFIGLLIMATGVLLGVSALKAAKYSEAFLFFGGAISLTILICGLLAVLCAIERHLRNLSNNGVNKKKLPSLNKDKIEPSLTND